MIIEAKISMIISFNPHKINIEITKAVNDSKLVGFNLINDEIKNLHVLKRNA